MPITPAPKPDKAANMDLIAAFLVLAWAFLRAQKDVDAAAIAREWQELRDAFEVHTSGP